jgi:defect in organelle trafficking protein DotD
MEKPRKVISIFLCCALGGCAAPKIEKTDNAQMEVDRQLLDASRKIERMQLQAVQAGALNQPARIIPVAAANDAQTISISWKGDAFQLLEKLAADRGLTFVATGVRLPLPVAINLQGEPFGAALDTIRAQTAYRATVVQAAGKLMLQFGRPQSSEGKL